MTIQFSSQVIFEDDEIRVFWQPGRSDYLAIPFGNLNHISEDKSFLHESPLRNEGISAIGIIAKKANWYPIESICAALPSIRNHSKSYSIILTYGSSMGGYAAIKHSALLGATDVIAYQPQWSIDIHECGVNPGWQQYFQPTMRNMGIRPKDISGNVFVFYDPVEMRDDWHTQRIREIRPDTLFIPVRGAGPNSINMITGRVRLSDIFEACLIDDNQKMRRISRAVNRKNPNREKYILTQALSRHPNLAIPLLAKKPCNEIFSGYHPRLPDITDYIFKTYGKEAGLEFYNRVKHQITNSDNIFNYTAHIASKTQAVIALRTLNDRVVVYDASIDKIGIRKQPLKFWERPLDAKFKNGKLNLSLQLEAMNNLTCIDSSGVLKIGDEGENPVQFALEGSLNKKFSLLYNGAHLSNNSMGSLHLSNDCSKNAEKFSLSVMPAQISE